MVLRGEGVSFSAGLDRQAFTPEGFDGEPSFLDLARGSEQELDAAIAGYQEAFTWWRRNDLITVAAVQGHAIGAGFQLALACDLRVCADDVQFAMRETGLGLVPDLTGTGPLVGLVGYGRALEICVTGRFVHAEEAERTGLANIVVPAAELDATVKDLTAALLAAPRGAVNETKALLRSAAGIPAPAEQFAAERAAQARRLRDLARSLRRPAGNPPRFPHLPGFPPLPGARGALAPGGAIQGPRVPSRTRAPYQGRGELRGQPATGRWSGFPPQGAGPAGPGAPRCVGLSRSSSPP